MEEEGTKTGRRLEENWKRIRRRPRDDQKKTGRWNKMGIRQKGDWKKTRRRPEKNQRRTRRRPGDDLKKEGRRLEES